MKRFFLILLVALIVTGALGSILITRDGKPVTPEGAGTVTLDAGSFEAFPLPDYAAAVLSEDYKSYFVEVEPGIKIHVLEVGNGYPVYMQHGNPTSGFLYRKVADILPTDRIRVIMPTMPGLGFSTKIPVKEHTLDNHMRWMNQVLVELELEKLVYVGQDWGGPVGMGALTLSPALLEGAVIMNTGLNAPTEKIDVSRAHAVVKTPIVGEFLTEVASSVFSRLPDVQNDPNSLSPDVLELYSRPVLESGNKKAPLALMRMVTDGPDHPSTPQLQQIESYIRGLDVPVEIVWGSNDPILGPLLPTMEQNFPEARVTLTEAGHFLQEEVPEVIAEAVLRLVDDVQASGVSPEEMPEPEPMELPATPSEQ